jgi:tRNA threonylcarbamoyladenosine biosynthesis protein TsaE
MELTLTSKRAEGTKEVGRILALCLKPGGVVALIGELGSGKTELVKGMAKGLGMDERMVTSPTYTLINEYEGSVSLFHFDFYRLSNIAQLEEIGADEYLWGDGICAVEWADMFPDALFGHAVYVRFKLLDQSTREIKILSEKPDHLNGEKLKKELAKLEY